MTREKRRALERINAKQPAALQEVPKSEWPTTTFDPNRLRVWRSRDWLVQEFAAPAPAIVRLSVSRPNRTATGWQENVTWDEMQAIKNEVGYFDKSAVEIYPSAFNVVNVANMRHLWVLAAPLAFEWGQ